MLACHYCVTTSRGPDRYFPRRGPPVHVQETLQSESDSSRPRGPRLSTSTYESFPLPSTVKRPLFVHEIWKSLRLPAEKSFVPKFKRRFKNVHVKKLIITNPNTLKWLTIYYSCLARTYTEWVKSRFVAVRKTNCRIRDKPSFSGEIKKYSQKTAYRNFYRSNFNPITRRTDSFYHVRKYFNRRIYWGTDERELRVCVLDGKMFTKR